MYKTTFGFHPPKSDVTIWRYIDFVKFVDLLESEALFFCRADNFEDPHEGLLRLKDYDFFKEIFQSQPFVKQFNFINCWHINQGQSDAMWRIFLKTNNGIAIKSTFEKLKHSFDNTAEDIYISEVRYKDFQEVTFDDLRIENKIGSGGASINQFTYKRNVFSHEQELRAFYIDMPIPYPNSAIAPRDPLPYKNIEINLNELIEEIVIAPFADVWFDSLVEKVVKRYGRTFKVIRSDLYTVKE